MTGSATGAGSPDRLFDLLPLLHRMRDEVAGHPLRDLLRVIAEQVQVVQDDIARSYDNWFIETAEDWAVPYLADLIGWSPVPDAGWAAGGVTGRDLARRSALAPRQDVANTLRHRRLKGTRALLEDLARDVADLPGHAVEAYRLLARQQHLNHLQLDRSRTTDVRDGPLLARIGGPFDRAAHTVDVRRAGSRRTPGLFNIPEVALFVQRLHACPVTDTQAGQVERVGRWAFTFDPTGFDVQLFGRGADGDRGRHPQQPADLPAPIGRRALDPTAAPYYGPGRSLVIRAPDWPDPGQGDPVPAGQVVPADLSDWESYRATAGTVAVDPVLGRMLFPRRNPPQQVRVSYHYGFGADLGGGEYRRPMPEPPEADTYRCHPEDLLDPAALLTAVRAGTGAEIALVRRHWPGGAPGPGTGPGTAEQLVEALDGALADPDLYALARPGLPVPAGTPLLVAGRRYLEHLWPDWIAPARWYRGVSSTAELRAALDDWTRDKPRYAVVEITGSDVLGVAAELELTPHQTLLLRAAERTRPVLWLADRQADRPDSLAVSLAPSSRLVLDGLVVGGRAVHLSGSQQPDGAGQQEECVLPPRVVIRHCTLVPGWGPRPRCGPDRPAPPALELAALSGAEVVISHSIVGPVRIEAARRGGDPLRLTVCDSILDATDAGLEAVGGGGPAAAPAVLDIARTTVFGTVRVRAVERGENSIFTGGLTVARRAVGCLRFCWVPSGSRTPRRFHCQPDTALAVLGDAPPPGPELAAETERRVRPRFTSVRYLDPGYAQLALDCPPEIGSGADDGSELGAFHDCFLPQRLDALRARVAEYLPASLDAGVLPVN
jgi:hypothetical protein